MSDLARGDRVDINQRYRLPPLVPPAGTRNLLGTGESWRGKPRQDTAPPLVPPTGERGLLGTGDSGQRHPRQDSTPEDVIIPSDSRNSIGVSSTGPVSEHSMDETKRTKKKHKKKRLKKEKESDNWKTTNDGHPRATVMQELQMDPMSPLSAGRLQLSVPYDSVQSDRGLPTDEGKRKSHKKKKERKFRGTESGDHEATANIQTPNTDVQEAGLDMPLNSKTKHKKRVKSEKGIQSWEDDIDAPQIPTETLQPEEGGQPRPAAIGLTAGASAE
jgi:hypothetical protein